MTNPIPTLIAALLIAMPVAFCWHTYRNTNDTPVRVASYVLMVLGSIAIIYVAYIRFLFSPCLTWW